MAAKSSMSKARALYEKIVQGIVSDAAGIAHSQMFGMPTLKVKGKAFAGSFKDDMVFKLSGGAHAKALSLKGAKLFDPSGMGRAMKEWVQVPFAHGKQWGALAQSALEYVAAGATAAQGRKR